MRPAEAQLPYSCARFSVFQSADTNNNGSLSRKEFVACLKNAKLGMSRKDINLLMSEVDLDEARKPPPWAHSSSWACTAPHGPHRMRAAPHTPKGTAMHPVGQSRLAGRAAQASENCLCMTRMLIR